LWEGLLGEFWGNRKEGWREQFGVGGVKEGLEGVWG
jgi:hypothetical protein